jgi:A/G-specific adenine glycosylase
VTTANKAFKTTKASKIPFFCQQISQWGTCNLRVYPWRQTSEPYAIFVAEFLLQKTDADTVVPIYNAFLTRYSTIEKLAAARVEEVRELLQPLGLLFRAERIVKSAQIVVDKYDARIPNSEDELLKLPGIGKYSARAICSQAFDRPLAVLDTNVARILERFFGLRGDRVKSRCPLLWQTAEEVAPNQEVGKWNLTLLDLGAKVCKAKNPVCGECPLQKQCNYACSNLELV